MKINVEPNEIGRKQFFEYQTQGKYRNESWLSDKLDNYFFVLKHGKHQFDLVCSEYHKSYKKGEFDGFLQLWEDWEGDRWLLKHLLKWHDNLPEWILKEDMGA